MEDECPDMSTFKDRLRQLRDQFFNGNNNRLALSIDVAESSVRGWLDGARLPNAKVVGRVCDVAGVNAHWLITGQGDMMLRQRTGAALSDGDLKQSLMAIVASRGSCNVSQEFRIAAADELARLFIHSKKEKAR